MGDERVVADLPDEVAAIRNELNDWKAQETARRGRKPTGDIEPSIRATPKENTLICQGQAVSRTDYADLWAFAQEQGHVTSGFFGVGDGSTTFTLPDLRGLSMVGSGTVGSENYPLGDFGGASSVTLTAAQMPVHGHAVSVNDHAVHTHTFSGSASSDGAHGHTGSVSGGGDHTHAGTTGAAGNHGGHSSGTSNVVQPGSGVTLPANYGAGSGDHAHSFNATGGGHAHTPTINSGGAHTHPVTGTVGNTSGGAHTVNQSNAGSGQAHENRSPYFVGNWLIWI